MTRRPTGTEVGSMIDRVLVKYRLYDGVLLARMIRDKEEVLGYFAPHLELLELERGRLTIRAENDAWRHEAELSKSQLLQQFERFAPGKVKKIFLT